MKHTDLVKNHLISKLKKLEGTTLNIPTKASQRTVADEIEMMCCAIAAKEFKNEYVAAKSVRSVDDFSIVVGDYVIMADVKSHYVQDEGFSMPNLISVKRLKNILEDPTKELIYIFVDYTRQGTKVTLTEVKVLSVYQIDWQDLTIGALGLGQLQIKNANNAINESMVGREVWFQILKTKTIEFYNKELNKIQKQIDFWIN